MQEAGGVFGPRVQIKVNDLVERYGNVYVTASKSGKLTKNHVELFSEHIIAPYVQENRFLLILDSWGGQTNEDLFDPYFADENGEPSCAIAVIPPLCAQYCQPCDVTFFRQVKQILKKMQNCEVLFKERRELTSREDSIKLHSIVHHQLSSPSFTNLIKYAWSTPGYTDDRIFFSTVNEVCFPEDVFRQKCCVGNCEKSAFIRCARCYKCVCFTCFYDAFHPESCT